MKLLFGYIIIFTLAIKEGKPQTLLHYFEKLDPEIQVSMKLQRQSGEVLFERQSQKVVPSASVIKIPILLSLLSAKDQKQIDLNKKYILQPSDIVGGSGDLQFEIPFKSFSYKYIAQKMISVSDNTATNILIDKLGFAQIQNNIEVWGMKNTKLNRKMMDFEAIKVGKQNYCTAEEMNNLLLRLLNKELLTKKSSKIALEFLLNCEDRTTIPRNIPANIPIAHKTGTLDYLRGDSGIIFGKNILIQSVFVENFESLEQAESIIGQIAEISYLNYGI